jgi:hypothetical protein
MRLDPGKLEALRTQLSGALIVAGHAQYDYHARFGTVVLIDARASLCDAHQQPTSLQRSGLHGNTISKSPLGRWPPRGWLRLY